MQNDLLFEIMCVNMKKIVIKKNTNKKITQEILSESEFWKKIAWQQQMIIHAKNRT